MKNKMPYIQGIKGLAACWVMIGHVIWNWDFANEMYGEYFYIITKVYNIMYLCVNNVGMFSVMSGFLYSFSKEHLGVFPLLNKIGKRYLKFAIKIFVSCLFVLLIQNTIGYKYVYTTKLELRNAFRYAFIDVFKGDSYFNGVHWMLADIFLGSVIAIIYMNVRNSFFKISRWIQILVAMICVALAIVGGGWIATAVMLGCFMGNVVLRWKCSEKYVLLFVLIEIIAFCIQRSRWIADYWLWIAVPFEVLILLCIIKSKILKKICSIPMLVYLGDISFWIYCVHIPIMYSFTAIIAEYCMDAKMPGYYIGLINIFVTAGLSVFCAEIMKKIEDLVLVFLLRIKYYGKNMYDRIQQK